QANNATNLESNITIASIADSEPKLCTQLQWDNSVNESTTCHFNNLVISALEYKEELIRAEPNFCRSSYVQHLMINNIHWTEPASSYPLISCDNLMVLFVKMYVIAADSPCISESNEVRFIDYISTK